MSESVISLPVPAARLVGDPHPLSRQLASPAALSALISADIRVPTSVTDLRSLRGFLTWYRTELLVPVEMPAIRRAFGHASRHEVRELIEFDHALDGEARLHLFAEASKAVGRSQLWRLLPMRDQRLVRRYWGAVESGKAHGWHILVYGVVLSVFSLPLRQGLMSYGRQTLAGFVDSANRSLSLPAEGCAQLLAEECDTIRTATEFALGPGKSALRICS